MALDGRREENPSQRATGNGIQTKMTSKVTDVLDEQELINRMRRGEQRAFEQFFDTFAPRLGAFAARRSALDASTIEDVVQMTMINAMRSLGTFRGGSTLFTWLCQICRRQIADHVRSQRRHTSKVVLIDDSEEVRAALESLEAPATDDPLHGADRAELAGLVHAVLDRLPSRYGEALEWKYVEGRSVEEISQRLGIGPTAAQSLLARARIAFREGVEAVFGASAEDVLASLGA
jgi:RNA polymerase sigma-70 factor (ECF subfamily)